MLYTINKPLKTREDEQYGTHSLNHAYFDQPQEFVSKEIAVELFLALRLARNYIKFVDPTHQEMTAFKIINKAITNAEK